MPFALVTGASKGIGKAIALSLASRGFDILLVARSADLLEKVAGEIQASTSRTCYWLPLDLAADQAAEAVWEWTEKNAYPVSVLVNNAGYGLSGKFESYTAEVHAEMLHLNIITLTKMTRIFLPELKKHAQAYILNIASSAAYQAVPLLSAYAASKTYVLNFSRGLYHELRGTSVSVTCISPGPTDTNFVNRANVPEKGRKTAERFNMTPAAVAEVAVKTMLQKKPERIVGLSNKLSAFLAWLMPKPLVETVAKKLYD